MVVLLEGSPISTEELWSSVRVTIGFLITSLTKALFPRLLSLAGRPALRKSLGDSKLLPFKNDGGHCFWGPSMLQTFFRTLPQICASTQSCLGALRTIPSTSCLGFFALTCTVNCGTLYRQVCAFPNPINLIYHKSTPIKL